ncbi:MAG: family 43 glycosylhydrolase [Clostridia bacterium]|nr:family 43 glycosylhydrolase [Clostridia bacterium]
MKKRCLIIRVLGLLLIAIMIGGLTSCIKKRPEEIPYTPIADGDRYKNAMEINGQWANSLWMPEGSEYGIGDPFVMRYNGKYYLYPSTADGRGGIKVYESTDLVNWTYMGFAVAEDEPTSVGAYAPEVIYYDGYFYMCQSRAGKGHYIYRSESPTHGFVLVSTSGLEDDDLNKGNLGMGIDGSFYVSDDGKLYIMHTSTPSGLKFNEITNVNNICPETVGLAKNLGDANLRGWIEGPGIIRRGSYTYLTYTGNHVISNGYRIAYSYANNINGLLGFTQPYDNVTLIDTDPSHRGLGHSSNFYGPDLDSIYTAYHSLVGSGPSRRYNLDRYLTNGGVMTANGVTNTLVLAPIRPTCEIYSGSELKEENGIFTLGATGRYFTAEYNLIPSNNQVLYFSYGENGYYSIVLENNKIILKKHINGAFETVSEKSVKIAEGKLSTVRLESGDGVAYLYINGMRVSTFENELGAGVIGYAKREGVEYTAFTNDVFGTSDFEALKNFPTKFPATSYLKGENRGFSIEDAEVVKGGLRVGERQSLVHIEEDDCYAVRLQKNDWIKYGLDISESSTYSISARITTASSGAKIRITIGDKSFECTLPQKLESEGETLKVHLGDIALIKGATAMKVEVISGSAEFITFEAYKNADAPDRVSIDDFVAERGDVLVENGILTVKGLENHSVALWGNAGICDFTATLKFTCVLDNSSNLGIMIRAEDYSYYPSQPTQSWRGYYLQIGQHLISMSRFDYGEEMLGAVRVDDAFSDSAKEHTLTITARSNKIEIILDGKYTVSVTDDCAFLSGQLGVFATSGEINVIDFEYEIIR